MSLFLYRMLTYDHVVRIALPCDFKIQLTPSHDVQGGLNMTGIDCV